jgi:hypothetical protein
MFQLINGSLNKYAKNAILWKYTLKNSATNRLRTIPVIFENKTVINDKSSVLYGLAMQDTKLLRTLETYTRM